MTLQEVSVLIVDDVNSVRLQIKELLKTFGFAKIHLFSNGAEAAAFAKTNECHLILADWHMEPMNGLELLKQIRADEKTKGAAFVMITAESTKEGVIQAIQAGVDDYLVKPMTLEQVQNKVFHIITKKKVLS